MKKLLLLFLLAPTLLISQSKQAIDTVTTDQLVLKGDLQYKIDTNEPFTGVMTGKWPNGIIKFEYHYVDGLQDGLLTTRYRNGKKNYEQPYKKGKRHGIKINYNSDEKKSSEIHYVNGNPRFEKRFFNDTISRIIEYDPGKYMREIKNTTFYRNGHKRWERIHNKDDGRFSSDTDWYSDGSKREEKGDISGEFKHKIWDHIGNELLPEAMVPIDTIDSKQIEWKNDMAHKKGNNNPFTGVMTFDGVLNYRKSNSWRFQESTNYSAVTLVFGRFNGPYTVWNEKNGKKIKEISIISENGNKVTLEGPYTHWHENGQMATKGSIKNGEKSGKRTEWHKNGQIKGEANYWNGELQGKFIIWDEDGKNSLERIYYNDKVIRATTRDEDGEIVKDWPDVDEDNYGLKLFLNEFVSILKSKNYDALKKILPSKEDVINMEFLVTGKEPSSEDIKRRNDEWAEIAEIISNEIDDFKEQVINYNYIFENLQTTNNVIYDYEVFKEDNSTERVKWPKSINYNISTAKYVTAEVTIVLEPILIPLAIVINTYYSNNKWYLGLKRGIIEIEGY